MQSREIDYREDGAALFGTFASEMGAAWLDSGLAPSPLRQRDYFLRQPRAWFWEDAAGVWCQEHEGTRQRVESPLFAVLRRQLPQRSAENSGSEMLLGFLSYDGGFGAQRAGTDIRRAPQAVFALYDQCLVQDHSVRRAWIIGDEAAQDAWQAAIDSPLSHSTQFQLLAPGIQARWSYAEYAAAFARVQEYIRAGDCYQINLTQAFHGCFSGAPWSLYRELRLHSRAPFSGYFRHPWGTLLTVSPERLLQVRDGQLQARPIKGTRPRAADPVLDRALAAELLASDKDRAENVMIVDLLRNDLGQVARIGSVQVPELFALESYDQVHHLVSMIQADLAPGRDAWDALTAVFPGGSVTGAPKRRAMEIISELEAGARGLYCGSFGYLTAAGDMDWNILIRSIELDHHGHLEFHGGGAVVVDSDCRAEYEESLGKVAALRRVLEGFLPNRPACATVAR